MVVRAVPATSGAPGVRARDPVQWARPAVSGALLPPREDSRTIFPNPGQKKVEEGVGHGKRLIFLGVLMALGASCLPIIESVNLLREEDFMFWVGPRIPMIVIVSTLAIIVAFVITMNMVRTSAASDAMTTGTMSHIMVLFTALLGLTFLAASLPLSTNTYRAADQLQHGCGNTHPETSKLMQFSKVLENIRSECGKASVEDCAGWNETKETKYLKHMETTFSCAPICDGRNFYELLQTSSSKTSSTALTPSGRAPGLKLQRAQRGAALLQQDPDPVSNAGLAKGSGLAKGGGLAKGSGLSRGALAPVPPLGVAQQQAPGGIAKKNIIGRPPGVVLPCTGGFFSNDCMTRTCFPVVAVHLQVVAWSFGDLMFWEGFGLLVVSVIVSVFSAVDGCRGGMMKG